MRLKLILFLLVLCTVLVSASEMTFVKGPNTASLDGYNYAFTNLGYFRMSENNVLNTSLMPMGLDIYAVSDDSTIYAVSVAADYNGNPLNRLSLYKFGSGNLVFSKNFSVSEILSPEINLGNDLGVAFFSDDQQRIKYMMISKQGSLAQGPVNLAYNESNSFSWYFVKDLNLTKNSTETISFQPQNSTIMRVRLFENDGDVNLSTNMPETEVLDSKSINIFNISGQNVEVDIQALQQNETLRLEVSFVPKEEPILLPYWSNDLKFFDS